MVYTIETVLEILYRFRFLNGGFCGVFWRRVLTIFLVPKGFLNLVSSLDFFDFIFCFDCWIFFILLGWGNNYDDVEVLVMCSFSSSNFGFEAFVIAPVSEVVRKGLSEFCL